MPSPPRHLARTRVPDVFLSGRSQMSERRLVLVLGAATRCRREGARAGAVGHVSVRRCANTKVFVHSEATRVYFFLLKIS